MLTLHASKGWPVAMISSAITAHFLIGAALIVYLPEAHRSIGLAQTTIIGAVLAGAGIVAWSVASAPWQLFVAAAISGSGWAATSGAAINAMVAPWFDRDRPKAIGLAFNGASIGGVMFPPLLILLIAKIGVEAAAVAVGIAMPLVIIPLSIFYLRRDPKGLGLAPDGLLIDSKPHVATPLTRSPRKDLIKTKGFMTLSVAFALALFAQVGLLTHLLTRISPLLGENGAAAAVSMVTTSAVLGRTLLGWTIGGRDRRGVPKPRGPRAGRRRVRSDATCAEVPGNVVGTQDIVAAVGDEEHLLQPDAADAGVVCRRARPSAPSPGAAHRAPRGRAEGARSSSRQSQAHVDRVVEAGVLHHGKHARGELAGRITPGRSVSAA